MVTLDIKGFQKYEYSSSFVFTIFAFPMMTTGLPIGYVLKSGIASVGKKTGLN
jgi:hypothetical protein